MTLGVPERHRMVGRVALENGREKMELTKCEEGEEAAATLWQLGFIK